MLYAAAGKTKKDREQLCFAVFFGTIKCAFKEASRLRLNVARFNKNLFRRKKGRAPRQEKSLSFMLTSGGVLRCMYRLAPQNFDIKFYYTKKIHPAFRPAANAINNIYIFGECRAQNRAQFRYIARIKTGNFQYPDKRDKNFAIFTDKKLTDVKNICNCRLAKKRDK